MKQMKIILLLLTIMKVLSLTDPSVIMQTLKSSLTDNLKMLTIDIGKTINGRSIIAYGITSMVKII